LGGVMYLVDLPGYGYAEAPVHIVEKWQQVLKGYLQGRTNLKRTYVLIDSRRGLNKVDLEIMSMLNKSAVSFQMVLTKTDVPFTANYLDVPRGAVQILGLILIFLGIRYLCILANHLKLQTQVKWVITWCQCRIWVLCFLCLNGKNLLTN